MISRKKTRKMKASALVYGLIIMFAVSILLTATIQFVTNNIGFSFKTRSKEQALHIAESGIEFYRWYLAHNVEGKTTAQIQAFWAAAGTYGVASDYERDYYDPGGGVIGHYKIHVTPPTTGSTIAIIKSTGWTLKHPTIQRTVQVRLRRPAWSEYTVLSNNNIRFGNGTTIQGKIFSNGGVHFDGVATNLVQSAVSTYFDSDSDVNATKAGVWSSWAGDYNSSMHSNVFLAGKQYPVATRDFTSIQGDLSLMKTDANNGVNGGRYFNNANLGREITLKNNDTFDIRTVKTINANTNAIASYQGGSSNYPLPDNGVIFVENNVWIKGTINTRKVTIAAADLTSGGSKDIYIEDNLLYTNTNGSDILGLVAQNDIEVVYNSPDFLTVDAALLAQTGRVGRLYYTSLVGSADHRNTITVYGAIASNQRYGFAWTDGTGYTNRNLIYDNDLLYYPPPYFPTGTQYKLDLWDEL